MAALPFLLIWGCPSGWPMMPALRTYLLPELSKLAPFAEAGARFARMEGRMRREKVDSTTLQSVGYESKGQVLEVEALSGGGAMIFRGIRRGAPRVA